ncbi:FtsX-like permease family protein [Candidatus Bathyarchaeota archaeon]|nr:FtsX-like permease family protein [Candidatus Bathyarchaeota archaeon]
MSSRTLTKEIGVMKAVDYKDGEILLIFVVKSLMVGILGGLLGIVFGGLGSHMLSTILGKIFTTSGGTTSTRGPRSSTGPSTSHSDIHHAFIHSNNNY